jgi:hypothetical protein
MSLEEVFGPQSIPILILAGLETLIEKLLHIETFNWQATKKRF